MLSSTCVYFIYDQFILSHPHVYSLSMFSSYCPIHMCILIYEQINCPTLYVYFIYEQINCPIHMWLFIPEQISCPTLYVYFIYDQLILSHPHVYTYLWADQLSHPICILYLWADQLSHPPVYNLSMISSHCPSTCVYFIYDQIILSIYTCIFHINLRSPYRGVFIL